MKVLFPHKLTIKKTDYRYKDLVKKTKHWAQPLLDEYLSTYHKHHASNSGLLSWANSVLLYNH